jgi:hypothetical protein
MLPGGGTVVQQKSSVHIIRVSAVLCSRHTEKLNGHEALSQQGDARFSFTLAFSPKGMEKVASIRVKSQARRRRFASAVKFPDPCNTVE